MKVSVRLAPFLPALASLSARAAPPPGWSPPNSSGAGSPITDFTVGVMAYVIVIGVLVAVLLIGGMLLVNLGLMAKREKDKVGGRTPSDVGILKGNVWPTEIEEGPKLPAMDGDGDEEEAAGGPRRAA